MQESPAKRRGFLFTFLSRLVVDGYVNAASTKAAVKALEAVPQGVPGKADFQLGGGIPEEDEAQFRAGSKAYGKAFVNVFASMRGELNNYWIILKFALLFNNYYRIIFTIK